MIELFPFYLSRRRRAGVLGLCAAAACLLVFSSSAARAQQQQPAPPPADNTVLLKPATDGRPPMPPSTATRRPDLFAPIPLYPRRDNYYFAGNADLRYRTRTTNEANSETIGSYVSAMRFTGDYVRANPQTGDERGGARFQVLLENDNQGTALNRLRASEVYAYYRFLFPGVSASLRGGQFVLPFGLMAVYDTPLQPIQPLYEKSIGLRVDTGIMLEGDYGLYHYAASVTTGAGPNRVDPDGNRVICARLERTFVTERLGRFQVGGSLMSGRLPITAFDTELPPSGFNRQGAYIDKSRFAGDGQYFYGRLVARGEIVFGGDGPNPVYGYFAEGNYQLGNTRATAVAFVRRWNFPIRPQSASTLGIGMNYNLGGGFILRGLFEYNRDVPAGGTADAPQTGPNPLIVRRFTLQTRLNF